ncbi:UDP-glucuronosyl/UDP-glucosyltransferase [Macleaya cordata]|uniref:Glycosyltransferase n=1 Tax=Macleaya cordata TaxID=56857 RepID=A0A200R5E4_MACCD|nr:UDP-glucuronosyl/UDP-glucosyltransferase [Macleaya cordata]
MASQDHKQLHFVLFPLMAQGHILPMIDMARLFAERGVIITIVTTPLNALRFKPIIDRSIQSGLPIRLLNLRFPSVEAGLPEGCETADSIPSQELITNFFVATTMLQEPLEQAFGELQPVPSCIISDMGFPWTAETAKKFQIPRIVFHGTCCFSLLCNHNILKHKLHESITSDSEPFVVPGLPDRIEITKATIPGNIYHNCADQKEFRDQIREAELTAYGVVVNSFEELEPKYVEEYLKAKTNKVWCIGPVSLCNKETLDKVERGNKASIDENQCLKWLDSREPCSVVYVCFGSLCRLTDSEMMELALGLEASGRPFVWVIRGGERYSELEKWLFEEKFEERTKDRGLVIKGWAPQVLILSHRAIGGFLTHCGWNSTLEGVCAGIPMITWPMFAEQFFNEKLVVQVLRIGVRVGEDDVPASKLEGEKKVEGMGKKKKEEVEKAVNRAMDGGEEGEERRRRVREYAEKARKAMEEGGSSHFNMTLFIQNIMRYQASKELPIPVENTTE